VNAEYIDGFHIGKITFGWRRGYRTLIASGTCSVESLLSLGCVFLWHLSVFCVGFNFQREGNKSFS
jgi:hypothetical protein